MSNPWENFINNLEQFDLPDEGEEPSNIESAPQEISPPSVLLQRITTEIWMLTSIEGRTFDSIPFQEVTIFDPMTMEEAKEIIAKRKKEKRRKRES